MLAVKCRHLHMTYERESLKDILIINGPFISVLKRFVVSLETLGIQATYISIENSTTNRTTV